MEWELPAPQYAWQTHYWRHVFSYSTYGAVTRSKLVDRYDASGYGDCTEDVLAADFSWTMQGELWWVGYPTQRQVYYSFDSAGRASGLVGHANWDESPYNPNNWTMKNLVTGTAFNKAGQMTSLAAYGGAETRSYDPITLQLTGIQAPSAPDLSYVYPSAGANNGRITAEVNNLTNTTVSYTYDQLNRLATATSVTGSATNWGLRWDQDANGNPGYDPYGNRRTQTVTAGSAPAFSATFDNNNRMVGYSYDQNGNQLATPDGAVLEYDRDNRMTVWSHQGAWETYDYHPSGWRVSKVTATSDTLYLYGPGGQLLSACPVVNGVRGTCSEPVYFAGRLLYDAQGNRVLTDRLGTVRAVNGVARNYYPFGEEITSTANNEYKFASTYRDSATGLDYAINRYYASGTGRFLSADPYQASGGPADPQSWNHYAYVQNDPANSTDPRGLLQDECQNPNTGEVDPDCVARRGSVGMTLGMGLITSYGSEGNSYTRMGTVIINPQPGPTPGGGGSRRVGPPTGAQYAGFFDAFDALTKPKCAELIAGTTGLSAETLRTRLWNATVTAGTAQPGNGPVTFKVNPDGTYDYDYQTAYTSGGNIELNGNYFPDPTRQNISLPNGGTTSLLALVNQSLGTSMNATQFGAFVFLHELSHMAGQAAGDIDNKKYNQSIISTCLN